MVYVPTILTTYGFQLSNSVILTGCMMVIGGAGSVVIGPLADKYGRKPIWSLYVIITIISLFLLTSTDSIPMLLFIGSFVAFFGTGIMPVCKVYIAEQYPTELRGVGTGFGEAVSRVVGGVLATYYLAFFLSDVYKRQTGHCPHGIEACGSGVDPGDIALPLCGTDAVPVSYTHLRAEVVYGNPDSMGRHAWKSAHPQKMRSGKHDCRRWPGWRLLFFGWTRQGGICRFRVSGKTYVESVAAA